MKVVDGFIRDPELLDAMLTDGVWETLPPDTGWYAGWWKQKPTNLWHLLIHKIWATLPNVHSSKGFEYWGNNIQAENGGILQWHQDKDERLFEDTGKTVSPKIGAVYYPYPSQFTGGYLEIANGNDFDRLERIEPVFNRLVIFDPSQYHRVSKVYSGYRKAFVVNVWQDHTPVVEGFSV